VLVVAVVVVVVVVVVVLVVVRIVVVVNPGPVVLAPRCGPRCGRLGCSGPDGSL
jgi:hypothetical protein